MRRDSQRDKKRPALLGNPQAVSLADYKAGLKKVDVVECRELLRGRDVFD